MRRRAANKLVRSVGLVVNRRKVDADDYSMRHRVRRPSRSWDARMTDLHGVDTIEAAEIINAVASNDLSATGVEILKAMPESQWCSASSLASKVWGKKVTWSARSGQWQKMGVELKRLNAGGYVHMKLTESNQKLWRRSLLTTQVQ